MQSADAVPQLLLVDVIEQVVVPQTMRRIVKIDNSYVTMNKAIDIS